MRQNPRRPKSSGPRRGIGRAVSGCCPSHGTAVTVARCPGTALTHEPESRAGPRRAPRIHSASRQADLIDSASRIRVEHARGHDLPSRPATRFPGRATGGASHRSGQCSSHRCGPRLLYGECQGNHKSSREVITSVTDSDKYHEPAIGTGGPPVCGSSLLTLTTSSLTAVVTPLHGRVAGCIQAVQVGCLGV